MVQFLENHSLKQYNTFGVEAVAKHFALINNESDLEELVNAGNLKQQTRLVLGGGSNVLFTKDFEGLVIKINIGGIDTRQQGDEVFVTAGAGLVWNDLVNYCVDAGFAGMENLSLIPGSVGASPVQNIGAYGVEIKDVFYSCRVFMIKTGEVKTFFKDDCKFDYRESIFKNELRNQVIITQVTFRLSIRPNLNTTYGAIRQELEKRGIANPTVKDISKIVSHIRVNKLPDPSTIGNAGSFFKNPIISLEDFQKIKSGFQDTVHYCMPDSTVKLAAGWLIEQCGWKGKIIGNVGTWKNQALVLVNVKNATGAEIYAFSSKIIADVKAKFGVQLEREVNII